MEIESLLTSNPNKTSSFIEDYPGNKHFRLANVSEIISYSSTIFIGHSIKDADLR